MVKTGSSSRLKLEIFKCSLCRRAFFSRQRQENHMINSHGRRGRAIPRLQIIAARSRQKKLQDGKVGKRFHKSSYRESVLRTLISNWPPENAYSKICKKHKLSRVRAQQLIKSMISSRYCPMLHSSQNVLNFLLEEYSKDSTTTRQRSDDICHTTGLSTRYIELWFLWRRTKGYYSPGNELLNETFFESPYPSDDGYQELMYGTGLLLSQIQLRFRLMRAKFQVLEFREAHEKILWACFMKNPGAVVCRKEATEIAGFVGMTTEDVLVMFEYWRMHWQAIDSNFREDISIKSKEICSSINKTSSEVNIASALSKVRRTQKIFGIPTRCQLKKKKSKSGIVTKSGYITFEPYIPQRSKNKANDRKKASKNLVKGNNVHPNKLRKNSTSLSNDLAMDSKAYSLRLKCNILKGSTCPPLLDEDDIEPNLCSLFSTIPSSQTCLDPQRTLPENNKEGFVPSTKAGFNEIECFEESDDVKTMSSLMPCPLNDVSEVIDLTQDSDSTDTEVDEVIERNAVTLVNLWPNTDA